MEIAAPARLSKPVTQLVLQRAIDLSDFAGEVVDQALSSKLKCRSFALEEVPGEASVESIAREIAKGLQLHVARRARGRGSLDDPFVEMIATGGPIAKGDRRFAGGAITGAIDTVHCRLHPDLFWQHVFAACDTDDGGRYAPIRHRTALLSVRAGVEVQMDQSSVGFVELG